MDRKPFQDHFGTPTPTHDTVRTRSARCQGHSNEGHNTLACQNLGPVCDRNTVRNAQVEGFAKCYGMQKGHLALQGLLRGGCVKGKEKGDEARSSRRSTNSPDLWVGTRGWPGQNRNI